MDDFLQDTPNKQPTIRKGLRYVFVLVFAIALLWQVVSFLQMQLNQYHQALVKDFRVILTVVEPLDNEVLNALGESLNMKEDISSVKLFSPADGLAVLQARNPRLAQAMVALGREQMPAYFELRLQHRALSNIRLFTKNLSAEYSQLSVKYSAEQADMIFYSGLCLRVVNITAVSVLVLFLIFMFLVEAYPAKQGDHCSSAVWVALLAGGISVGIFVAVVYPTGVLMETLSQFTTVSRQLILLVFCGLLGWTLGKWQKF